ncbi:RING-H2 finger protein ATL40 [Raphanus sativus]|uniref:RING-type E3 ubiquitin transferase n=1 Tax=Raphanus sativus TaxID=3726 RepID=A0A6J0JQT2_RAPSA|nr:RING-H2 finger protein ATL40 [Raphanus sativus]KAJ4892159.1 RING-H2 finger protein ATL40 [Raphanus sativus]
MSSDNGNSDQEIDPDRLFWQNTASYNGSSKILLITIVAFSIIILIVFAYHIYERFVLRRRRSTFQDHTFSVVSEPPKRGLDKVVIASLPTFVVGVNGDNVSATECAVCLTLLEEKAFHVRMLPNCKHVFHVTCVDTWLTTRSTCPICRNEVEPSQRLEPEPREGPVGDGASSSDNKSGGSLAVRLDSFRRILTRERSSDRNDHSRVDQDRVLDLERQ